MPDHTIHLTDDDRTLIERVQAARGFPSIESAAEWLVKTRLRRAARSTNGRGRAMYVVPRTAADKASS